MTTLRPPPRLRRASVRAQDEDTSHIGSTESRAMAAASASETPGRGRPRDRIDCSGCSLVTCPSGRRSTLGKRVLCKQPRVRIPPSPPKSTKGPRASGGPSCFSSSTGDSRSERSEHRSPAFTGIHPEIRTPSGGVPPLGRKRAQHASAHLQIRRSALRSSVRPALRAGASCRGARRRRRHRCCSGPYPGAARALRGGSTRRTASR
jgi:hypothetical protein